jgi:hypothetical protein
MFFNAMSYFSVRPEGQVSLILGFLKKAVNIKENGDVLIPKLIWGIFNDMNRTNLKKLTNQLAFWSV